MIWCDNSVHGKPPALILFPRLVPGGEKELVYMIRRCAAADHLVELSLINPTLAIALPDTGVKRGSEFVRFSFIRKRAVVCKT
jgi:hypothetical protein